MIDEALIARCLAGDPHAWDDVYEADVDFIIPFAARATTEEQFGLLGAGPLDGWRVNHQDLDAMHDVLPAVANLLVASERRAFRAGEVMTLLAAIADDRPAPPVLTFVPRSEAASRIEPGAHPLTESLLLPNYYGFGCPVPPPASKNDAEIIEIADRYVRHEDEDYWEELDQLIHESARDAWRVILALLQRENEINMGYLGAGPVETLVTYYGEVFADDLHDAIEHNPAFVRAFAGSYLYTLSESLLMDLAATCRRVLSRR